MRTLVVGGAGYVGGATVWALQRAGHSVAILDDLSEGSTEGCPATCCCIGGRWRTSPS